MCAAASLAILAGIVEVRAQSGNSVTSPATAPADYSDPALWVCRPGRVDACAVDLDATIIASDGSTTREAFHANPDAPIDCFYIYPTVSEQQTGNANLAIDHDVTLTIAQQFARFGGRCRLFAPVYRQVTIAALKAMLANKPIATSYDLAYADVVAAFLAYLSHDNHGRGFVLVGHSQGARHLARLVREEIDGKPIQRQMVSALLIGEALPVKADAEPALVFPHTPLCRTNDQLGCVIAFSSFRAETPPAAGTFLVEAPQGMHAACANPAALDGGSGRLDAYLAASDASAWTDLPRPIDTPFVKVPGLLNAQCVVNGQVAFLAVSRDAAANGPRAKDIKGEMPDWGLHLIDMNLTMGNLLHIVGDETRAYLAHGKK
jgi:hypothetical protein